MACNSTHSAHFMSVNVHESKLTFCGLLSCVRIVVFQAGSPQWLAFRPIYLGVCVWPCLWWTQRWGACRGSDLLLTLAGYTLPPPTHWCVEAPYRNHHLSSVMLRIMFVHQESDHL